MSDKADVEQQNHAMAPLLDFANHCHTNYSRACMAGGIAYSSQNGSGSRHGSGGAKVLDDPKAVLAAQWSQRSLRLLSPRRKEEDVDMDVDTDATQKDDGVHLKEGEEVFFPYGGHDDETLFAEYGFVPEHVDWSTELDAYAKGVEPGGNPHATVNIDKYVKELWERVSVNDEERQGKRELLEIKGYLGYVLRGVSLPRLYIKLSCEESSFGHTCDHAVNGSYCYIFPFNLFTLLSCSNLIQSSLCGVYPQPILLPIQNLIRAYK